MKLDFIRMVAAIAIAGSVSGAPKAPASVAGGRWGGEHVLVEVSDSGAAIEFDCAHGSVSGAIAVDAEGRFDVGGGYVAEHGGPVRVGESETPVPVRYTGRVQGRTMSLTVELGGDHGSLGPFALGLGNEARIVHCR